MYESKKSSGRKDIYKYQKSSYQRHFHNSTHFNHHKYTKYKQKYDYAYSPNDLDEELIFKKVLDEKKSSNRKSLKELDEIKTPPNPHDHDLKNPEDDKEIFENILYNDKFYGINYVLEIPDDLPELQSIEDQRNRDINSNLNTINNNNKNFGGGFRPNNPTRQARNLSFEKKQPQTLDHSKFMKRKGRYDIFVGNLPYNADEVKLKQWFEKNGLKNMEFDVRITMDKDTGKPRGFGFVSVFNKEDVNDVVKLNGKDEQKKLIRWQKIAEASSKQSRRDKIRRKGL